jgi:predicted ATP-dependent serine protease
VLGGGIVPGPNLLGGEPGIEKHAVTSNFTKITYKTLYVS